MSEWWTYRLSDFLLFSPDTYYRLFELYHRGVWPVQLLAAVLGIVVATFLLRPWNQIAGRGIAVILAAAWIWVAWAFQLRRYATINWAAAWFAAAFALQALLLWSGAFRNSLAIERLRHPAQRVGIALFLFSLLVHPLVGLLMGRSWIQAELFALTPDATALATLGVVLAAGARLRAALLVVPLLWCAITGATLWTMHSPETWVIACAAAVAVCDALWRTLGTRQRRSVQ